MRERIGVGDHDICYACAKTVPHGHDVNCPIGLSARAEKDFFLDTNEVKQKFIPEGGFSSEVDRRLFDVALKIVSGEILGTSQGQVDFAKRYLEVLSSQREEHEEFERKLSQYNDIERGRKLEEFMFSDRFHLRKKYDEMMGIDNDSRKPFSVRVLDLSASGERGWEDSEWYRLTNAPSQFMVRGNTHATIYLSKDDADLIISQEKKSIGAAEMLVHEYRHTQRKFSSENDKLLRILDEPCTNVGLSYQELTSLVSILFSTTSTLTFGDAKRAYDSGSEVRLGEVISGVVEAFGEFGFLIFSSRPSSDHTDEHDGIRKQLFSVDIKRCGGNEKMQFLEEMLTHRSKVSPNWLDLFKNNIFGISGKSFQRLEVVRKLFLSMHFKDVESTDAILTKSLVKAIDDEIVAGLQRGETSFYS